MPEKAQGRSGGARRPSRGPRTTSVSRRSEVRLMEGTALGIFILLIVGSLGLTSLGSLIVHTNMSAAVEAAVMVDLTNENRVQNALPGLTVSPVLVEAAQEKADDEAAKSYFAHTSPQGLDSWYWFKQVGYDFTYAGENLAVDFTDSAEVVNAWMNSPEHRANILDGHYTQIGIATASGMYQGHPTIFVVQEFGTPADGSSASAPVVASTQPAEPTQMAEASTTAAPVVAAVATTPSKQSEVLGSSAIQGAPKHVPAQAAVQPSAAAQEPQPEKPANVAAGPMIADSQPVALPVSSATALATPPVRYSSQWDFFLASPATSLRYAYYVIAFLVLLALLLTTGLEFREHHRRATIVAGALLAVMFGLFLIANVTVFGSPTVAQAASAIAAVAQ